MGKLTTKLVITIGAAAIFFSGFLFHQIYRYTQLKVTELVQQQASLVLELDLAVRQYVATKIKPDMIDNEGSENIIPETMSTSCVAWSVFDDIQNEFPDLVIKLSTENPRNLKNKAGLEERELIRTFKDNPDMKRWQGELTIDGKPYLAEVSPLRMQQSCLLCHGEPTDAPTALIDRYGSVAGFHMSVDKIAGLDTVAIPMGRIKEMSRSQFLSATAVGIVGLLGFLLSVALIVKGLIINRLKHIVSNLQDAPEHPDYHTIKHVDIKGDDEIAEIATGYNTLTEKLSGLYVSLEDQLVQRTADLEKKNIELKNEVTNRVSMQASLENREANLRAIFRAVPTGIGMVSDRVFKQVNEKLCSMLGYTPEELLGRSARMLYLDEEEYQRVGATKYEQIKKYGTGSVETVWQCKDGRRIDVLLSSTPVVQKDFAKGVTFTALDITAQKVAEEEKKYLEQQLIRSQKMEALGLLAGGVAHDLNNVLSGIVSYPELILMDLPKDSPLYKAIGVIQESGRKAEAIVQDLLTLARRGVTRTEVLNLNTVLKSYIHSPEHENIHRNFPAIEVVVRYEDALLNISGSSVHLRKTIMNLVINAAEAIGKSGKIEITTENRYVDRPIKGYEEVVTGDYIVLTVRDNGIGIAEADLQHIFEPFYTKKIMGRSGTGLGMSVVWGTIQDHSGYINVTSALDKGTTFELFFPVSRKKEQIEALKIELHDYLGNNEQILIVDDDATQRQIGRAMLRKLGYRVACVSGGEEAVEYLKTHSVSLIILDMIMDPGIDGLETYRRIVQIDPGQKTLIASGFSESDRLKEAQRLGAGEYVKKPYTLEHIGMAIKNALNK
jgi:PAS domain S-box-containing protein